MVSAPDGPAVEFIAPWFNKTCDLMNKIIITQIQQKTDIFTPL